MSYQRPLSSAKTILGREYYIHQHLYTFTADLSNPDHRKTPQNMISRTFNLICLFPNLVLIAMYPRNGLFRTKIVFVVFTIYFARFAHSGWIRSGDAIQNALQLLRVRRRLSFLLLKKSAFKPGLLFSRKMSFARTCHLSLVFAKPYYPNVHIDREMILDFW